jgi:hypothetical protein
MFRKVFISYAKEDYRYASELFDYLHFHYYEPWLDKKCLLAGSNWDLEIRRALEKSDFIILLLSSTSVSKRGYVQKEYKLAMQHWERRLEDDIYIIPLLINECSVPESLNRFQWVRYEEEAFRSILTSLDAQRKTLLKQIDGVDNNNLDSGNAPSISDTLEIKEEHFEKQLGQAAKHINIHEFTYFETTIITLLAHGMRQKDIPEYLLANQIRPYSLSSIEKRLNLIKEKYSFSKNEQLVAFCKDIGLI